MDVSLGELGGKKVDRLEKKIHFSMNFYFTSSKLLCYKNQTLAEELEPLQVEGIKFS